MPKMVDFENLSSFYSIKWRNNLVLEEKDSEYQKIIISFNEKIGKTLFLDDVLQICEADVENYNIGLSEKLMEHLSLKFDKIDLLVIGGGDGFLTEFLLNSYKNINSITVVELDKDVISLVNKHFRNNVNVFDNNKVQLKITSGDTYVEECINNNVLFHGIIIDCTDYTNDINNPANVLFSKNFYNNLNKILITNGYLTQQFDTIDTLSTNIDGKYKLRYPKIDIFDEYHFENVNCFSYGSPTYMLHLIKN